ncbi:hypothetical protein BH11BAC7_BH11BAC7_16790 [soil metagenome]
MKTRLLKSAIVAVLIAISTNMFAYTAVTSGPWSSATTWGGLAPGATVSNQDIIIPTGITVDLDIDVLFNGLINSFTVDGTLNSAGNFNVSIQAGAFAGSGNVDIHRLSFSGLLVTSSYSGSFVLNSLQNQGAAITFAATGTVSDTLDLDAGSFILGTGSNVTMQNNSSIRINAGTLTSTGGLLTTGSPYDVWYLGNSKTTGLEVNSSNLRNLHIDLNDNTQVITQGINNLDINGTLNLTTGRLDFSANQLTLKGDFMTGSTAALLIANGTSDLTIMGAGPMTSTMIFTATSSVNNLELDRTSGTAKLGSALAIVGTVFLTDGDLVLMSGSTLTMNASSTVQVMDGNFIENGGTFVGTASYNVDYIGSSHTAGVELTGAGLNDVMVGLSSANDTVMLADNVIINGNLDMNMGMMALEGNDLTLDGTFDQNANAQFVGDSTSEMTLNLTSTGDTLYFMGGSRHLDQLTINIPTGTSILLATDLTVHNSLDLMSGKIEITNANLYFSPSASVTGFDDTRYIVTAGSGQVSMRVNSNSVYVTFPIGTTANYSPAFIQQSASGNTGDFLIRTMPNVYSSGTSGFDASSTEGVVDRSWVVNAASNVVVNMNIRLGWKQTEEVNGFNRNQAHIAKYNNSTWDSYMNSAATAGPNTTYEITRMTTTSGGVFAVVDSSAVLGMHNETITAAINVYPNPTADVVTIETGSAHTNYLYEVFDATGNLVTSASNANPVNKFDLASYSTGFYFIKITNVETHAMITKRIVKN